MSRHVSFMLLLEAWGVQYLLWALICWMLWWLLGSKLQRVNLFWAIVGVLPFSIATSVVEEMIWVMCFPNLPLHMAHMDFWPRVFFQLRAEMVDGLVIFWCAFFLFRAVGYYQRFREKEATAAQLQIELVQAQLHAVRANLNPHFLFNTLNSISSLMRTDVSAADLMLEQFSNLLRMSLERGNVLLIPLRDEMEFVEMYMAMQDRRFAGRVSQDLRVQPELHDALVPAMILQPILENAYSHGLSQIAGAGLLKIEARKEDSRLRLDVLNSGVGINPDRSPQFAGHRLGLTHVQDRLRLHFPGAHTFSIREVSPDKVLVSITLPLRLCESPPEVLTRYGA
ncbi:MAG TPA: histidine kinase [Candidatus Aquilonibacter sp.]|nr:histidine kinase [Candidatus Aquilonibacter sp.]